VSPPARAPGGRRPEGVSPGFAATAPLTVPPDPPATWTAVVAADRAYYDSVQAADDAEGGQILFPDRYPERRFRLAGTEVRIGRRSVSRNIEPEIDLAGPTLDPGVSRLHAVLTADPDGTWSVTDAGSDNGIRVNGRDVPPDVAVPLHHGDRIHLGAWTVITITRG
jgi:pSer/pThr/pTyr-binding forkhead associated (FHA) protein